MTHLTQQKIRPLLTAATERSIAYLDSLDGRGVAPQPDAVARLRGFNVPLQDLPIEPTKVLEELDTLGSPATMAMAGPRFFGFVIGGSLPAALAANWLAGAWD